MAHTPTLKELHKASPAEWVQLERAKQDMARGEQNHNAFKWFTILMEEVGETARVLEYETEGKYKAGEEYQRQLEYELIQVAAVAVAWVEAIRRKKGTEKAPACVCGAASCNKAQGGVHD